MNASRILITSLFFMLLVLTGSAAAAQHVSADNAIISGTGGTGTIHLVMDKAPKGLAGYNMILNITNPAVARVKSCSYPSAWTVESFSDKTPFTNGLIATTDYPGTYAKDGATDVWLQDIVIEGHSPGTTTLKVTFDVLDSNHGDDYRPTTEVDLPIITVAGAGTASVRTTTVAMTPLAIADSGKKPADRDTDGLYEDVNGDGVFNYSDVTFFFYNWHWIDENEPVDLFDYDGNSAINFGDIVQLNQMRR